MRRQIEAREVAVEELKQGLRAETRGLEKCIEERTAELLSEVEERRKAELLNWGRNQVLEFLAKNEDLTVILNALLMTLTTQLPSSFAAIHRVEGNTLVLCATVGVPEMLMGHIRTIRTDFVDASESSALREGAFSLMAALVRTPWSQLMGAHAVHSSWSLPFYNRQGAPVGVLTIYTRLRGRPAAKEMELLEMGCALSALVFEHQRLHRELLVYAYHDALTGLPNRRMGEDRLDAAIYGSKGSGSHVAVLWLDVDHFKQINDEHGHAIGDMVLQEIGARLAKHGRSGDVSARMGGDEFMVILQEIDVRESAELIAHNLYEVIAAPMRVASLELLVTASIGISFFPVDGETAEQLKRNADHAMYQAKFERVGTLSFSAARDVEAAALADLKEELTRALKDETYQIAYQPQFTVDGVVLGFEALLRFRHPLLGVIEPSKFIPVAEQMGLIVPLGAWVLRAVCEQSMAWQRMGYAPLPIAVNISALQFARKDFASTVGQILDETGLDASLLELEVTESVIIKNFAESSRQLQYLKHLGIRIAIDDFGTGYSSLSYLHQLPIDVLKIDRSFVSKLLALESTRPIIEAILAMAHNLGLSVVAEGVETNDQRRILREAACDRLQGYFFTPALRPELAARLLTRRPAVIELHATEEVYSS